MAVVVPVGANVGVKTVNATLSSGTGGEPISTGQVIYQKSSDNEFYKAVATSGTAEATVQGIAIQPSTDGKGIVFIGQEGAVVDVGATLTEDTWYTLSSTAGSMEPVADSSSGDYRSWIGYGNPDGNLVLYIINTGLQKS